MAVPIEIVSLQFGPCGTEGRKFSVPVRDANIATEISTTEEADVRVYLAQDVAPDVRSAMGFRVPVSTASRLDAAALLITTSLNEYLFPLCRISDNGLDQNLVCFTIQVDRGMVNDDGGSGCRLIKNGSKRPTDEIIFIE